MSHSIRLMDVNTQIHPAITKSKIYRLLSVAICCIFHFQCAVAGTIIEPDSVASEELKEVVVKGAADRLSVKSSVYTPSGKERRAAQNISQLLQLMAIPQLRISPNDDKITDNAGDEISIFINYLVATPEDMAGVNVDNVRRVEYLLFPGDPRFHGAEKALNIIVMEYEYGGYTKLSASENIFNGLSSRASVFSKFRFRKMTYDLFFGSDNRNSHHHGNSSSETMSLTGPDGNNLQLTRDESLSSSSFRRNQFPLTFRATYDSSNILIRNTVGFTHLSVPRDRYEGLLAYSLLPSESFTFNSGNPSRSNSISYNGSFYFQLSNSLSFDFSPSVVYTHTNDYTSFIIDGEDEVSRHAQENALNYLLQFNLTKSFGRSHSLMLLLRGGDKINRLKYPSGNLPSDRFHNGSAGGMAGYNFRSPLFNLRIDGGVAWEQSNMNDVVNNEVYPFTHLNLRYSPNRRHLLSFYFQYASSTPGIAQKSPDILKKDEVMFISGNPMLENSRHTTIQLDYTWLPYENLELSAYGSFFGLYNREITSYSTFENLPALLRKPVNSGDFLNGEVGLSINWSLLNNDLQISCSPNISFFKSSGTYRKNMNHFALEGQVDYYLGNFYFGLTYNGREKAIEMYQPAISTGRDYYRLSVGWSDGNWKLRASCVNIFNNDWRNQTLWIDSPLYSAKITNISPASHAHLEVSATYVISYGRKMRQSNEIGKLSDAPSAILK